MITSWSWSLRSALRTVQLRHFLHSRAMNSTNSTDSERIRLELSQGSILGVREKLPNNNSCFAFRGIPYAQPPLGKLRFQPPVPLEKFTEPVLECSKERGVCLQKDSITLKVIGSEDCLYLNVYTPQLQKNASNKLVPVMIWIHGGAYMFGSSNSDIYSPDYLVQEDVVVVTMNYRLGPFGFMYLPEAGIFGNAGLKDQLLAIKWVNENIERFGGDPGNVTLFGESAGGSSTHIHALSEKSRKYFHKAICQSGTALMEWGIQNQPEEKTRNLAILTGCKATSSNEILEHLLDQPAIAIFKNAARSLSDDEKRRGFPTPFKPVVEPDRPDAILTKSPLELLSQPNATTIPMILGYNNGEGLTMLADAYKKLDVYEKDLARMIPKSIDLQPDDPKCLEVAEEMRQFYFNGEKISTGNLSGMCKLQGDYHFVLGCHLAAELNARYEEKAPLYFYRFDFEGDLNFFKKLMLRNLESVGQDQLRGACHGDDIFYLFVLKKFDVDPERYPESLKTLKEMVKLWTNFAKFGKPNHSKDTTLGYQWRPISKIPNSNDEFHIEYLEIGKSIEMKRDPDYERIQFWREIYRKWNGGFLKANL